MEPEVEREIGRLDRRLQSVEGHVIKQVAYEVELRTFHGDIADCRDAIKEVHERVSGLRKDWQTGREQDAARREEERRERRKDFWTFAGVAVAAVGASGWIVTLLSGAS